MPIHNPPTLTFGALLPHAFVVDHIGSPGNARPGPEPKRQGGGLGLGLVISLIRDDDGLLLLLLDGGGQARLLARWSRHRLGHDFVSVLILPARCQGSTCACLLPPSGWACLLFFCVFVVLFEFSSCKLVV